MVTDSCFWVQHLITADGDTLLFPLEQLAIVSSDMLSFVSAERLASCWFGVKHVVFLSITPNIWCEELLAPLQQHFFLFFISTNMYVCMYDQN